MTRKKIFLFQFIYEGVSYLTLGDEARVRKDMKDGILLRALERDVSFREEDLVNRVEIHQG